MICSKCVKSVLSVSLPCVALAMPKSITLAPACRRARVTRMFDGLMSRWMMPFLVRVWTAEHTSMNSSSRWRVVSCCSSQNLVIGTPFTSSMTKYGRPLVRRAGVEDLRDVRMVHHRQRLALGLEARDDFARVHARLDDLERHAPRHRLHLFGHPDDAESALADLLE